MQTAAIPPTRLVFGAQEHGYELPGVASEKELESFEREHAFLPLIESLEQDGDPAAAAVRAALDERRGRAGR